MSLVLSRVRDGRSDITSAFSAMYQTGFPAFDFLNGQAVEGYREDGSRYRYYDTGIVDGTFNQIIGRSGCGKTTWAIQCGANIIKQFEKSDLFIRSIEGGITIPRLERLVGLFGKEFEDRVDFKDTGITTETLFKDIMDIYDAKVSNKDEFLYDTGKIDSMGRPIVKYQPTVMVIDSIAMMVPDSVDENDTKMGTNMTGAALAKANTGFIKRITQKIKEVNIIILAINHINDKVDINPMMKSQSDNSFLKQDETLPGGKAMFYLSTNVIRFKDKKLKSESYGFDGLEVAISNVKSRTNRSEEDSVPLILDYNNGFNPIISNMLLLKQVGVVNAKGAYMQLGDHSDMKFTNKKFLDKYFEDEEFRNIFNQECLKALKTLLPTAKMVTSDTRNSMNTFTREFMALCSNLEEIDVEQTEEEPII